jgi:hypothetical protein
MSRRMITDFFEEGEEPSDFFLMLMSPRRSKNEGDENGK